MRNVNYSLISCLFSLVLGLILVIWPETVANYLVFAVGLLFLIPGIVSIVMHFIRKSKPDALQFPVPVAGVGSMLFGLLLIVMPSFFADMLLFVLGLTLAVGGLFQIVELFNAREWVKVSYTAFILPILLFALGIITLFNPANAKETMFFIIGIGVLVYTVNGLINWFFYTRKRPKSSVTLHNDIEDAEIVEN